MLSNSNIDVAETLNLFKQHNLGVGFLVPTETGLVKSIMDAHFSLRRYFALSDFHDFEKQKKGPANKATAKTILCSNSGLVETKTSLYRPETKNGDPRIWISKLPKQAKAGDLLAITVFESNLIVINCSQINLDEFLTSSSRDTGIKLNTAKSALNPNHSGFGRSRAYDAPATSFAAQELLEKLGKVHRKGWIQTKRPGDTGVGFTLETLLGIQANSSKKPDYKGIELKSGRLKATKSGQTTVFSQVPNWKISNLKGSKEILEKRGRFSEEKKRIQLFHEISSIRPNSYDLMLKTESNGKILSQIYVRPDMTFETDVSWLMEKLINRVEEKHAESMWISADSQGKGESESFLYQSVKHTLGVDPLALPILLESGAMTVHYLIKQLPSGAAKDQGYLFKMSPKHLTSLFHTTNEYLLADL